MIKSSQKLNFHCTILPKMLSTLGFNEGFGLAYLPPSANAVTSVSHHFLKLKTVAFGI